MLKNSAKVIGGLALGGAAFSSGAAAQPAQTYQWTESRGYYIPCLNEWMTLEGKFNMVSRSTDDNDHVMIMLNATLRGVSEDGTEYRGKERYTITERIRQPGADTQTLVSRFHMVGTGSAPDIFGRYTFHITENANGEITAETSNYQFECK
jgi:hypothetical protein